MIICYCGYKSEDADDFGQHQLASINSDEDHFEVTPEMEPGGCICSSGECRFALEDELACTHKPTQEDLLCDECRELKGKKHCHICDAREE